MAVTVVKGDTLNAIAKSAGISLKKLLKANPDITNPNLIQIGQVVQLPGDVAGDTPAGDGGGTPPAEDTTPSSTYTVVKGDTLGAIAKANNISLTELLKLNPDITNPNLIQINQTINLPGGGAAAADGGGTVEAGDPPIGVLNGGELIRVNVNGENRFYQIYEFPPGSGSFVSYQFNDRKQVVATFGADFDISARSENWFDQNVLAQAPAEEVIGQNGNFQALSDEIMKDAATAAGVRDPGLIGQIAADPEMQQIMAQAVIGEWTQAQIIAEQRNTTFWKETLYPGIERFYGKTANPEQAWKEYSASVEPSLRRLGYTPDANGSFDAQIKDMLDGNIDAQTFLGQVPTFLLATQNAEFAGILNQWTERDLGVSVGFNEWFDLLEGNSAPEVEQVAENARLAWLAQNQGTDFTNEEIVALAERTNLSDAQAAAAFSEVNQAMLALGQTGLERGGLSRDEIVSAAAGIAPESGRSVEEVRLQVAKVARENDLFDEEKINFFVGFDPLGRPNRPGLQSLNPEGA